MSVIDKHILVGKTDQHIHYLSDIVGIHQQMASDFSSMQQAAQSAGIDLSIASGFRSFDKQLAIFNNKANGKQKVLDQNNQVIELTELPPCDQLEAILLYSALPGASRHHWGTDIDVYDAKQIERSALRLVTSEYQQGGPCQKLSQWLQQHANDYGFFFPYDKYRGGVAAEPWHLSYAPLSQAYDQALTVDIIGETLEQEPIALKAEILENLPEIFTRFIQNIGAASHE